MNTSYKKLVWGAFTLFLAQTLVAQVIVSKEITEDYPLTDAGELHLENKYGDIQLYGWDKDTISITMVVEVNHKKRDNAEAFLRRITPVFRNGHDYVSLSYELTERRSNFISRYFNKANPFDFDRSNVRINYTIYLPNHAEVNVTHKFGDVIIENWKGRLRAQVEHGDVWINEDLTNANLKLKYGKLRAKSISSGSIRLKNGELDMKDAKNLHLNSSGSEITLETINSLEIYSSKDNIAITEVNSLYGDLKFTTIELTRLGNALDLSLKISDFRIDTILDPKADIALQQESSEISLNVTDFPLHFEAVLEEGLLRLPKSFDNVASQILDKGKRLREIKATYGKNPQGKIAVQGNKGVIVLKVL